MNHDKESSSFLIWSLPLAIIVSVILTSFISLSVKDQIENHFQGLLFVLKSKKQVNATLYYSYGDEFDPSMHIANSSESGDTLKFDFPHTGKMVKKFRLDLGSKPFGGSLQIKSLFLRFEDKQLALNEEEVFDSFFVHSASVGLDKNSRQITLLQHSQPFDPYIVFSPLGQLAMPQSSYLGVLLLPFFILLAYFLSKSVNFGHVTVIEILVALFVLCIPLKIAWTTFCTILLCAYGLAGAIKHKKYNYRNTISLALVVIFLIYLIFGRPASTQAINKEFALLLFAFIGTTVSLPVSSTYRTYLYTFLFLNAALVSSGLSYLLRFGDFYGLDITDYFSSIKVYSGHARDWLYYDHAAFLSFFGLVGLLFLGELRKQKRVGRGLVYLYHVLLVLVVVLLGSRICLILYAVYVGNLLVETRLRTRWVTNLIIFALITIGLAYNIQKIDTNRYQLWAVTWEAIKERPWLGYGLGESERILTNNEFVGKAGVEAPEGLNHSHNQVFTSLLEIGVLGTLCIAGVLFIFMYHTKQYRNVCLGLFLLGTGYIFLTESVLQTSKPLYVICFLFLLLAQWPNSKFEDTTA